MLLSKSKKLANKVVVSYTVPDKIIDVFVLEH